jgi:hypothetical protein
MVDVQFVASVLAWMAVAWVVGQSLRPGWPRWLGSGLVLGFALTGPVTLWDRQLLTESLSLTFLATTFAARVPSRCSSVSWRGSPCATRTAWRSRSRDSSS